MTKPLKPSDIDKWTDEPTGPVALHLKQKLRTHARTSSPR